MTLRRLIPATFAGALFLYGSAWAGQDATPPAASQSSDTLAANSGKERHWSGDLVDIPCMAKALNSLQGNPAPGGNSNTGAPQFMGSGFTGQAGQQPGGQQPGGVPPGSATPGGQTPATSPSFPNQGAANPDMNQAQTAQMAKAERIDKAAKGCVASPSTQVFGLAMSGGQVVKFDNGGDSKAQEALKTAEVKPGKSIKAKITGVMQDRETLRVASVEVKGKRSAGNAAGSTSGTGQ